VDRLSHFCRAWSDHKVGASGFGAPGHLPEAARAAFVSGLNAILEVSAVVAAIGAVLALLLVRRQDFVASGPQPG
jgi:hypothetical protein